MAREEVTSIEVKKSTWKVLNGLKEPGDSFDDVVQQLLARPEPGKAPEQPDDPDVDETGAQGPHDDALDCPDCGRSFNTFDDLKEHMDKTDADHT